MEGRARRKSVADGRGGKKFKNALAELSELRKSGKKRADVYEVREEEAVYEEVNEDEYARIVQKRREEGGGFVVGADGLGYTDIGEEIEWVNEDAKQQEKRSKQNRSGGSGNAGRKRPAEQPVPGAKERMQKMFQAAALKSKPATKAKPTQVNATETDALLDDILGDLDSSTPNQRSRSFRRPSIGTPVSDSTRKASTMSLTRQPMVSRQSIGSVSRVGQMALPKMSVSSEIPRFKRQVSFENGQEGDLTNNMTELDSNPSPEDFGGDDGYDCPMYDDYDDPPEPETDARNLVSKDENAMELEKAAATPPSNKEETLHEEAEKTEQKMADVVPSGEAAISDWKNLCDDDLQDADKAEEETPWEDDGTLNLDESSRLYMYLLDAHEEISSPGTVYLFGKTPVGENGQYASCCTIVKGVQRTIFVVPKDPVSIPIDYLDSQEGDERKERLLRLHDAFSEVKKEVRDTLGKYGVTRMTMKPVCRTYAFEDKSVKHGTQWVLKIRFPASNHTVPLSIKGKSFIKMFGSTQSSLEALMLKRRIMGPSWIAISKPKRVDRGNQVSYCSIEVEVDGHKSVFSTPSGYRPAPPICVASISLKTLINSSNGSNEVVAASVVYIPKIETDGPLPVNKREVKYFSAIRKLDGMGYPVGFEAMAKKTNEGDAGKRNGGAVLAVQPNERALLTMLVMRLRDLDIDAYVGHNFAGYDLDVLLNRMKDLKVPHWSSLGRLKRSKFPSLGGGGHTYGGGAGAGALSAVAGRLICDTYLAARDLVRETEYTLTALSKALLGELRFEISSTEIKSRYLNGQKLYEMVQHTESDAWLAMRLSSYLAVLPLTRQLAELSGSLWSKALLNQRAQRIEYLLLHEFHKNKFILPDKMTSKERAASEDAATTKKSKGPQYAGGLVLEPKKGLYERYILLLDFNSLYPSIIQEYNICFTTVERPSGENIASLPEASGEKAPLPRVIGALVERRRRVKEMIKTERDSIKKEQLNIRQQALKLLANSMYGCLGFSNSRFYAKPLAELITSQGREILQSTVELVQSNVGREVIYGDTDSIMVDTNTDSLPDVIALGHSIKKEVNKRYRLLEIEMDGVFKRMLLLKKKKYAAIKVERAPDGSEMEIVEAKGLDMVRRDWCPLAKQASHYCLDQILSGRPREEVVAGIHEHLSSLGNSIREGTVPLNKYVITKQLTKNPEDYPDAKNQPHVQVALRRRAAGKRDGVMPGETIPYIICATTDSESPDHSLSERARSPEEISASEGKLKIDIDYYISQQVFPVICRLVAPIEGTNAAHIAESLGMDPSKFKAVSGNISVDPALALENALSGLDNDDRFKDCEPLKLRGRSGEFFEFKGVRELLKSETATIQSALTPPKENAPLTPVQVANQLRMKARDSIKKYYEGWLISDDEMVPCQTRNICLREPHDGPLGSSPPDLKCSGVMHPKISEASLYTQLSYFHRLFDVEGALKSLGNKDAQMAATAKLAPIRNALDLVASEAAAIRDKSGYRWVNLSSVFSGIKT